MKVLIQTGIESTPTCTVEVSLSLIREGCIEIDVPIDIHPEEDDRPDELDESYDGIAKAFGFNTYELDERDPRTMWIWER